MNRSIGRQILIPIAAIQTVTVVCVSLATAALAAARTERQIIERINGVADTVENATFPLTAPVLARIRELSGAELVVLDQNNQVLTSTIPGLSPLFLTDANANLPSRVDPRGSFPRIERSPSSYFAVRTRSVRTSQESTLILFDEANWRRARWEAVVPPLVLGLVSLGLMTIATFWVAERIRKRLFELRTHVARIAAGEFSDIEPGEGRDEVVELSRSINQMSAQLRQMKRSIVQTERTRLLAQVAAGLAHQLRNSISGARMSIQLHAKRSPAREGDRSLEVALRQLAMTEGQIRGLLSLGKVEEPFLRPMPLAPLIEDVVQLADPTARHSGVMFDHRSANDAAAVIVHLDPDGLQAAILNLVHNAIEAAGQGGSVHLSTRMLDERVAIEISDTGPGPSPELADSLLEPFVTSKPEGVGLGLALTNEVANKHGGDLAWERRDNWTVFRMTLPVMKPEDAHKT